MKKCPNCSTKLSNESKFCANCGTKVINISEPSKHNKNFKQNGRKGSDNFVTIISSIILIAFVAFIFIQTTVDNNDPVDPMLAEYTVKDSDVIERIKIHDQTSVYGGIFQDDTLEFTITNESIMTIQYLEFNIYLYNDEGIQIETVQSYWGSFYSENNPYKIRPTESALQTIDDLDLSSAKRVRVEITDIIYINEN